MRPAILRQRQHVALVLEQHDRALGDAAGFGAVLGGEHDRGLARGVVALVGVGEQAEVALDREDAPHRLVEPRHQRRIGLGQRRELLAHRRR